MCAQTAKSRCRKTIGTEVFCSIYTYIYIIHCLQIYIYIYICIHTHSSTLHTNEDKDLLLLESGGT